MSEKTTSLVRKLGLCGDVATEIMDFVMTQKCNKEFLKKEDLDGVDVDGLATIIWDYYVQGKEFKEKFLQLMEGCTKKPENFDYNKEEETLDNHLKLMKDLLEKLKINDEDKTTKG